MRFAEITLKKDAQATGDSDEDVQKRFNHALEYANFKDAKSFLS